MQKFVSIANMSKDGKDFVERARKLTNISPTTSNWFFERYDEMDMFKASDKFVKEVKEGEFDIEEIYADGGMMAKGGYCLSKIQTKRLSELASNYLNSEKVDNEPSVKKGYSWFVYDDDAYLPDNIDELSNMERQKYGEHYTDVDFIEYAKKDWLFDISENLKKFDKGGEISIGSEIVGSKKMYFIYNSDSGKKSVYYDSKEKAEQELKSMKDKMFDGGVTFDDKVNAISRSLMERKKVSPSVQKDYGKTYSRKEAIDSAKRIAGAMRKKKA